MSANFLLARAPVISHFRGARLRRCHPEQGLEDPAEGTLVAIPQLAGDLLDREISRGDQTPRILLPQPLRELGRRFPEDAPEGTNEVGWGVVGYSAQGLEAGPLFEVMTQVMVDKHQPEQVDLFLLPRPACTPGQGLVQRTLSMHRS